MSGTKHLSAMSRLHTDRIQQPYQSEPKASQKGEPWYDKYMTGDFERFPCTERAASQQLESVGGREKEMTCERKRTDSNDFNDGFYLVKR